MRPALVKVALVWAFIAAIVPSAIGIVMMIHPASVMTAGTTAGDAFRTLAYRNFGFTIVLLASLLTQPRRTSALLLVARGLMEWGDGLSGVFISHDAWIMPAVGGLGDFVFAWVLYRSLGQRAEGSPTS